ncbi:MAG TPA: hypothetical protein VLJ16_07700 [Acidobacteriota bacterium]|nr:hypothetical protein [Acidobacteriota bacterium]
MNKSLRVLSVLGMGVLVAFAAVASSSCSHNAPAAISIQIVAAPGIVTAGRAAKLVAVVSDDTSAAGVDWSASGAAGGSFSPAHTASGAVTVFTAGASAGTVTLTATSTSDGSAKASLSVAVVAGTENVQLSGPYVFAVQGENGSGAYVAAGTIVADGDGHITAGRQDYVDASIQVGPDALTGSYAIGADGRGSLQLDVVDTSLALGGLETFSLDLSSSSHALLIQFDASAASSGSLDRQAASALDPAAISGAFAFAAQGTDLTNRAPIAQGGVLAMDASAGTISAGTYYENDGGSKYTSATSGTVTAPDLYGRGTLSLGIGVSFVYYAVQGHVLRLVTSNTTITTAGSLFGQGAAGLNGTFSIASLAGDYAFSMAGGTSFGALALAGQFTADGAGNFTAGVADANDAGTATFGPINGQARYTIAANGVGTLTLPASVDQRGAVSALLIFAVDPALDLLDPNESGGNGGALILDNDTGAVGTGMILGRSAGAFDGDCALNLTFVDTNGGNDWVGPAAAAAGAWSGTVDVNNVGLISAGLALTGTYAADAANVGRWTGSLIAAGDSHSVRLYQVSGAHVLFVDIDQADVGIGYLDKR